jgi:hypothetical protein
MEAKGGPTMALERSILTSVKKTLGFRKEYTDYDHDVITHINSAFFTLNQLGIGPPEGFAIEDETDTWDDFVHAELNVAAMNALQTYFYLKLRLWFDPPEAPHHVSAMKEQVEELEHRLKTERELTKWNALPSSSPSLP